MNLSLGTAQFGLDYGITNHDGKVTLKEVGKILELAKAKGVKKLDTAISYGESENVLGQFDLSYFDVITKIPTMDSSSENIKTQIKESLHRLNISKLYGILLHNENDIFGNSNAHLKSLIDLKNQGLVDKIGASFYSIEKAKAAIESGFIDIIQIPANILDSRFELSGIYHAALEYNIEVHVRSLFLQGLLSVNSFKRPRKFKHHQDLLDYDLTCEKFSLTPLELALMYLSNKKKYISYGVVGCLNQKQLEQILAAYERVSQIKNLVLPNLSSSDDILLTPTKW